jgi:muramoyltetrapeptide carboxypeptidase LdcA involved in peptidoglycan recycling
MRYPKPLQPGGTIGFIAPSFGCAIEPYKTRFENALRLFREMGYKTYLGPNCYEGSGIGISNTPEKCGEELTDVMTTGVSRYDAESGDKADAIITCGGGELMCEVVPFIDFEKISNSEPKWYMGYSDNTNYTFLSTILADTAAIYGPCAPAFGREPWHESITDALKLLTGEKTEFASYDLWEKDDFSFEEESGEAGSEDSPVEISAEEEARRALLPYNVTEPARYFYYLPQEEGKANSGKLLSGGELTSDNSASEDIRNGINIKGRLLGGCVDILTLHVGTKTDKVAEFLEKYKDDGFIWFLECCDLDPLSMRRAFWQMREAGWFKYVKGFMIGRPLHFGEEALGVDQYNAVTDILGGLGAPIIMDLDIGHVPPMLPIVSGSLAEVKASGNKINMKYIFV